MSEPRGVFRTKRLLGITIMVSVFLLGGLFVYLSGPSEPSYHGKKLSWWIHQNSEARYDVGLPNRRAVFKDSKDAIKAIGTNAIPTLLRWFRSPDSRLKSRLNAFLDRHPFATFRFQGGYQSWQTARDGFNLLGNDAMPAVPALTALLDSPIEEQRVLAFDSILSIDHDKKSLLPVIVEALQRTNDLRFPAANYICNVYPERAEKLGVYRLFPKLKSSNRVTVDPVVIPPSMK